MPPEEQTKALAGLAALLQLKQPNPMFAATRPSPPNPAYPPSKRKRKSELAHVSNEELAAALRNEAPLPVGPRRARTSSVKLQPREEEGQAAEPGVAEASASEGHNDAWHKGPQPPNRQPPSYLLKKANNSLSYSSTWQAAPEQEYSEDADGSAWRPAVKKATYWQRQRGKGGGNWTTYFQSETPDESWGDWMPRAEEAVEDDEEEAQDDTSTLPDRSQPTGHAKDGRLLLRTRGGTVRLIGSSDGIAPAPVAPKRIPGRFSKGIPFTDVKAELEAGQGKGQSVVKEELDQSPQARLRRAVAFLTKPQMLRRTWDQKRSFLKSQGLNDEEILEARQRAEWAGAPVIEEEGQDAEPVSPAE